MLLKERKEQFIQKAREKHNDTYDYSKFVYINARTKGIIICKIHGEFPQTPDSHTRGCGCGCPKCGDIRGANLNRSTKEQFIQEAMKTHGDRYDYSKFVYKNSHTKGIIICNIHGDFEQNPANHCGGNNGCPICGNISKANSQRSTKEEFIQKAMGTHGDRYSYDNFEYINTHTQSFITCKIHGDFEQTPSSHILGSNCSDCVNIDMSILFTKSTEEFIQEATKEHGDRYDYSKFVYKNSHTKGTIICKIHGEFPQIPGSHISGSGCPKCGNILVANLQTYTKEQFIEKAMETHGDRYDYSKFEYKDAHTKGIITCKIHGDFEQTPNTHLRPSGCTVCAYDKFSVGRTKSTEQFIQEARETHGDRYDYSKFEYKDAHTTGIIRCKIHGEFPQIPGSHIRGCGCPSCVNKTEGIFKKYLECNKDILKIINVIHKFRPKWANLKDTHKTFYEYDFYIEFVNGLKIIVEIDGPQHHKQISNWTTPLHNQIRDNIKERLIRKQEDIYIIRLLQEDVFQNNNNWQIKFEEFINNKFT